VKSVTQVSRNTYNVLLQPKAKKIDYAPGQFAFLKLYRESLPTEEHPFTISSSPTNGKNISFTIKNSGDYTSTVKYTVPGDRARIDGPYGHFSFLRYAPCDLLFIAGGVGITPILSMIRYLRDTNDERSWTLIWGNRTEDDIIFRKEIEQITSPDRRVIHVLSEQEDWQGERGIIDKPMLDRLLNDNDRNARVFLCGPPPMMTAVRESLRELGIKGGRIHTERFAL